MESRELDSFAIQRRQKQLHPLFRSVLAGGIAGCCAKTIIAPLDRIKILFQTHNPHMMKFTGTWAGPFRALRQIYNTEGFLGVYRGNTATLLRIFPYAAIQYTAFEQYRKILPLVFGVHSDIPKILAGSMAGATSVLLTYPLDLMRTRLAYQVADVPRKNVLSALLAVYQEGGIRQLYRGLGPTLLGIVPYAGVTFFTYHELKETCFNIRDHWVSSVASNEPTLERQDLSTVVKLLCGGLAGATGQTSSYPLDIVRRRMQAQGLSDKVPFYRNTWDAITTIWKTQGWRGFYIGLSINYIKVTPAVAVSFVTYEFVSKKLDEFASKSY